jgi:acetolactate synthase-1/2/3 large subunit
MGPIGFYMGKRGVTKFLKPMIQAADVVLLIGNRTNQNGTDSWTLLPQDAQYIHIDLDPLEISRNYEALRLVGDARLTLTALAESLAQQDLSLRYTQRAQVEETIRSARRAHAEEASDMVNARTHHPIAMEYFMAELEKQLADDHIIVADASNSSVFIANYIKARGERRFIYPRGLAGLGWGLPLSLGAKVACPTRPVFSLSGDGGFAHVWSELETAKREKINVVAAVINNGILSYQKLAENARWGRNTNACDLTAVDHAAIAEACGIRGIRITRPEEIAPALAEAFSTDGPVVLDIIADPATVPPIPMMEIVEGRL